MDYEWTKIKVKIVIKKIKVKIMQMAKKAIGGNLTIFI